MSQRGSIGHCKPSPDPCRPRNDFSPFIPHYNFDRAHPTDHRERIISALREFLIAATAKDCGLMVSLRRVVASAEDAGGLSSGRGQTALQGLPMAAATVGSRGGGLLSSVVPGGEIQVLDLPLSAPQGTPGAAGEVAGNPTGRSTEAVASTETLVPSAASGTVAPLPTVEEGLAHLGRSGTKLLVVKQPGGDQSMFLLKVRSAGWRDGT